MDSEPKFKDVRSRSCCLRKLCSCPVAELQLPDRVALLSDGVSPCNPLGMQTGMPSPRASVVLAQCAGFFRQKKLASGEACCCQMGMRVRDRQKRGAGGGGLKQTLKDRLGGAHLPEQSFGRAAPSLRTRTSWQRSKLSFVQWFLEKKKNSGDLGAAVKTYPGTARVAIG